MRKSWLAVGFMCEADAYGLRIEMVGRNRISNRWKSDKFVPKGTNVPLLSRRFYCDKKSDGAHSTRRRLRRTSLVHPRMSKKISFYNREMKISLRPFPLFSSFTKPLRLLLRELLMASSEPFSLSRPFFRGLTSPAMHFFWIFRGWLTCDTPP